MFNCLLDSSWREEYIDIGIRECSWGHCCLQRLCRQRRLVGLLFPLPCEVGWSSKGKTQVQRSLLIFLLCESVLILSWGCCYAKFFWRSAGALDQNSVGGWENCAMVGCYTIVRSPVSGWLARSGKLWLQCKWQKGIENVLEMTWIDGRLACHMKS